MIAFLFAVVGLICRHERLCGEQNDVASCRTSGQYNYGSFVACEWNRSVMGTFECRTDFPNVANLQMLARWIRR